MDIVYFVEALRGIGDFSSNFFSNTVYIPSTNSILLRDTRLSPDSWSGIAGYEGEQIWAIPIPLLSDLLVFEKVVCPIFFEHELDRCFIQESIDKSQILKRLISSGLLTLELGQFCNTISSKNVSFYSSCQNYFRFGRGELVYSDGVLFRELVNFCSFALSRRIPMKLPNTCHTANFIDIWHPKRGEMLQQLIGHPICQRIYELEQLRIRGELGTQILKLTIPQITIDEKDPLEYIDKCLIIREKTHIERDDFARYLCSLSTNVRWELPESEWMRDVQLLAEEKAHIYKRWSSKLSRVCRELNTSLKWIKLGLSAVTGQLISSIESGKSIIESQSCNSSMRERAFLFLDLATKTIKNWNQ